MSNDKNIVNIRKKKFFRITGTITALLLTFLMTAGCGQKAGSTASYAVSETASVNESIDYEAGTMRNDASAKEKAAVAYDSAVDSGSGTYTDDADPDAESSLTESEIEAAEAEEEQNANDVSRKLIKTVTLNTQTTEFDRAVAAIDPQVKNYEGYVESSSTYKGGYNESSSYLRSADYTIRIPADKLAAFLNEVSGELHVTNRSENSEDITLRYTDLESRVKALESEQDRLFELMAKAENVDAVIAIESRLSEVLYELESIKSSLRVYDNQVLYSTIYLNINEVKLTSTTGEASFSDKIIYGLENNLIGLRAMLESLAIFIITELPVIIVLGALIAVLIIIVRKMARAVRRRKVLLSGYKKDGKKTETAAGTDDTQAKGNEAAAADKHTEKKSVDDADR